MVAELVVAAIHMQAPFIMREFLMGILIVFTKFVTKYFRVK